MDFIFHGRVLPERIDFRLDVRNQRAALDEANVEFSIFCFGSEFNGTIKFDRTTTAFIARDTIRALLRSILDRHCYANICAYDFDLVGCVAINDRAAHIFGVNEPVFHETVDDQISYAKEKIPFLNELLNLSFHTVRLDHALRCFNHALRDQALTPLFCYLAIETIARGVVEIHRRTETPEIRSAEWEIFRKALCVQQATITTDVKDLSDKFRHGNFANTSWEERKRALALTWEIIRRSLFYIRNATDLPEAEFPLL